MRWEFVREQQRPLDQELRDNAAGRKEASPAKAPPHQESRAGPEMVPRFNQELRSSGKFMVTRQVQGQAGKFVHVSGSGPEIARQSHMTRQVQNQVRKIIWEHQGP